MGFSWQKNVCKACGITLTVKYLLTECQKYEKDRINLRMADGFDDTLGQPPE